MKPLIPFTVTVLVIVTGTAIYIGSDLYKLGRLPFLYSPIQTFCHNMIADRLKSPSSLKIITSNQFETALDFEESKKAFKEVNGALDDSSPQLALFERFIWPEVLKGERHGPMKYQLLVEYDAANGFGSIIRGGAVCEMYVENDNYPSPIHMDLYMKLNGKTGYDWKIKIIKSLN